MKDEKEKKIGDPMEGVQFETATGAKIPEPPEDPELAKKPKLDEEKDRDVIDSWYKEARASSEKGGITIDTLAPFVGSRSDSRSWTRMPSGKTRGGTECTCSSAGCSLRSRRFPMKSQSAETRFRTKRRHEEKMVLPSSHTHPEVENIQLVRQEQGHH